MGITSLGHQNYLPAVKSPGLSMDRRFDRERRPGCILYVSLSRESCSDAADNVLKVGTECVHSRTRDRCQGALAGFEIRRTQQWQDLGECVNVDSRRTGREKCPVCTVVCKQDCRRPCQRAAAREEPFIKVCVAWRRPLTPGNRAGNRGQASGSGRWWGKGSM